MRLTVWTVFKDKMLTACPELFSMPTDIAWDYVYTRESLATLKGKKLHYVNEIISINFCRNILIMNTEGLTKA